MVRLRCGKDVFTPVAGSGVSPPGRRSGKRSILDRAARSNHRSALRACCRPVHPLVRRSSYARRSSRSDRNPWPSGPPRTVQGCDAARARAFRTALITPEDVRLLQQAVEGRRRPARAGAATSRSSDASEHQLARRRRRPGTSRPRRARRARLRSSIGHAHLHEPSSPREAPRAPIDDQVRRPAPGRSGRTPGRSCRSRRLL